MTGRGYSWSYDWARATTTSAAGGRVLVLATSQVTRYGSSWGYRCDYEYCGTYLLLQAGWLICVGTDLWWG